MRLDGTNVSKVMTAQVTEKENGHPKTATEKVDYDPYNHPPKVATTYLQSLIIVVKACLGTGILAMARTFRNTGYLAGLIGTIVVGFVTNYAVHMLVDAEYELCKRKKVPQMSYPDTAKAAFESGPRILRKYKNVAWFMCHAMFLAIQGGACCVYIIFVADNLKHEIDVLYQPTDIRVVIAYLFVPVLLISLIRDYKFLSPLSLMGHGCTAICYGVIFYNIFNSVPTISDRRPVGTFKSISLGIGTLLFALECITCVIPVKNGMSSPRQFGGTFGILNMSMTLVVGLSGVIGLFGYLKYGEETKASITLNLPQDDLLGHAVRILLAATVYVSYGVYNFVVYDSIWPLLSDKIQKNPKKLFYEYAFKVSLMLLFFSLAFTIPNLELFISFLGSLSLPNVGLLFPAIIETLTFWDELKGPRFYLTFTKNVCLMMVAIFGCVIGVVTSATEIYNQVLLPLFV